MMAFEAYQVCYNLQVLTVVHQAMKTHREVGVERDLCFHQHCCHIHLEIQRNRLDQDFHTDSSHLWVVGLVGW